MSDAKTFLELASRLEARSVAIDHRLGPIPGRDADAIAVELRNAAAALRSASLRADGAPAAVSVSDHRVKLVDLVNRFLNAEESAEFLEEYDRIVPRYSYAHMCQDNHIQIGHTDGEHEQCPLCRAINALETARECVEGGETRSEQRAVVVIDTVLESFRVGAQ